MGKNIADTEVNCTSGGRIQSEANLFSAYAAHYDLLYKDKDYKAEANFISDLIQELTPNPPEKIEILDLACGTGRHAMELRQLGYKVEGSDISKEMIAVAIKESKERGLSIPYYTKSFQTCARKIGRAHV